MNITERLQALRGHNRHDCGDGCHICDEVEQHLDAIQTQLDEILARLPAGTDTTPAHIELTAS